MTDKKPTAKKTTPKRKPAAKKPVGSKRGPPKEMPESKRRKGKTDPNTLLLEAQALEYRKQGAGFQQIADELEISIAYAHKLVQQGLDRAIQEPAQDLIRMQIERCNSILLAHMPKASMGDAVATDKALAAMRQLDTYHGIGAAKPTGGKASVSLTEGEEGEKVTKFEIEFINPPSLNDDQAA